MIDRLVLDASAWVDILLRRSDGRSVADGEIVVPPHFDVEVIGAIRSLAQRGALGESTATDAVDRHLRMPFTRSFDPADAGAAWELREAMSFRDAWYVALARRLDAPWVTADSRAAGVAERLGVQVRPV